MSQADEKDACGPPPSDEAAESTEGKDRPGMPNKASVVSEKPFVSPKGKRYRIIKTKERDAYDAPARPPPSKKRPSDGTDD